MRYLDWASLPGPHVESIAHSRALEQARNVFSFTPNLPEDAKLSATLAELIAGGYSEFVSVKSKGAKGDGATDDTKAFQEALDASRYVYAPPGEYVIRRRGYRLNNTGPVVEGEADDPFDNPFYVGCVVGSGRRIVGSGFDTVILTQLFPGEDPLDASTPVIGINLPPGVQWFMLENDAEDVEFENLRFVGQGESNLRTFLCSGAVASGTAVTLTTVVEHDFTVGQRIRISGSQTAGADPNELNTSFTITAVGANTITFDSDATGPVTGTIYVTNHQVNQLMAVISVPSTSRNLKVNRCWFENQYGFPLVAFGDSHYLEFTGNRVKDCQNGPNLNGHQNRIVGNWLLRSEGFECSGSWGFYAFNHFEDCYIAFSIGGNQTVDGQNYGSRVCYNIIEGLQGAVNPLVVSENMFDWTVEGNVLFRIRGNAAGVLVFSTNPALYKIGRGKILNNDFIACHTGVRLATTTYDVDIDGNHFIDRDETGAFLFEEPDTGNDEEMFTPIDLVPGNGADSSNIRLGPRNYLRTDGNMQIGSDWAVSAVPSDRQVTLATGNLQADSFNEGVVFWNMPSTGTVLPPTNALEGHELELHIRNAAVNAQVGPSWNAIWELSSPAPASMQPDQVWTFRFRYDGTAWQEMWRRSSAGHTAVALSYGAAIDLNSDLGSLFTLTVTDTNAFEISDDLDCIPTQLHEITIEIVNGTDGLSGPLGAMTFGQRTVGSHGFDSTYFTAGAFTQPGAGLRRYVSFIRRGTGWYETYRSPADI